MEDLLRVAQPGLMTLLIGLPKPGLQRYGVSPGGAMDTWSLRIANLLARNPPAAQALEITLLGPTLEVRTDCLLALAGADLSATLDGTAIDPWNSFLAPAGSVLKFGPRRSGARAYLAAAGGLILSEGHSNKPLAKGAVLLGSPPDDSRPHLHLPPDERPSFTTPAVLRLLPGPHRDRFSAEAREKLVQAEYEVALESNRMGIRLAGPSVAFAEGYGADILSEPTPPATVQVPGSGQPIILMADCPTTGGYAKIATVVSADITRAAQLAPGDRLRFEPITLAAAQQAWSEREQRLANMERMATWPPRA